MWQIWHEVGFLGFTLPSVDDKPCPFLKKGLMYAIFDNLELTKAWQNYQCRDNLKTIIFCSFLSLSLNMFSSNFRGFVGRNLHRIVQPHL